MVCGADVTWYCMALRLLSTSPLVRMMPFSSILAFFSQFSLSTRTTKRLRRTMAALPLFKSKIYIDINAQRFFCDKKTGRTQAFVNTSGAPYKARGWQKDLRAFFTFNNLGDLRLVCVKFERCQESQGAQMKGHNWWNTLLQSTKEWHDSHIEPLRLKNTHKSCLS